MLLRGFEEQWKALTLDALKRFEVDDKMPANLREEFEIKCQAIVLKVREGFRIDSASAYHARIEASHRESFRKAKPLPPEPKPLRSYPTQVPEVLPDRTLEQLERGRKEMAILRALVDEKVKALKQVERLKYKGVSEEDAPELMRRYKWCLELRERTRRESGE